MNFSLDPRSAQTPLQLLRLTVFLPSPSPRLCAAPTFDAGETDLEKARKLDQLAENRA